MVEKKSNIKACEKKRKNSATSNLKIVIAEGDQ